MNPAKAVFLDRDGVLIKDHNLLTRYNDVEIFSGVSEAISLLRKLNFRIILFTNQTVVARGLLSAQQTRDLNFQILNAIKAQKPDAIFDDVFMCFHHPKANVEEYRVECECRKPRPGMILEAKKKFDLDLSQSFVVGDRPTDIYAGKSVGCRSFLIRSGEHEAPLIETSLALHKEWLMPDLEFDSLIDVAKYLEKEAG